MSLGPKEPCWRCAPVVDEMMASRDATHTTEVAALRRELEEARELLREEKTTTYLPEDETGEGGYDFCVHCGYDAMSCDTDGKCWGAKVRAFLRTHDTPAAVKPGREG